MSGTTSGTFNAGQTADNDKKIGSHVAVIPAAGTAQVVNPADNQNAVTVYNLSTVNMVRATVTFVAGIVGDATAAQQTFLVPAGGTFSVDFSNNAGSVSGLIGAIESVSFVSVAIPAATSEASTLPALAAAAGAVVVANFASN